MSITAIKWPLRRIRCTVNERVFENSKREDWPQIKLFKSRRKSI